LRRWGTAEVEGEDVGGGGVVHGAFVEGSHFGVADEGDGPTAGGEVEEAEEAAHRTGKGCETRREDLKKKGHRVDYTGSESSREVGPLCAVGGCVVDPEQDDGRPGDRRDEDGHKDRKPTTLSKERKWQDHGGGREGDFAGGRRVITHREYIGHSIKPEHEGGAESVEK